MVRECWWVATAAWLMVLGTGHEARASLVHGWMSIGDLVTRSSDVFIGNVIDARSVWDGNQGEICTIVTLEVQSELKGRADDDGLVRLRVPGGRVGGFTETVIGAPTFAVDETVLVFVADRGDGLLEVVGMAQGKYAIRQEPYSGLQFAVSDTSGLQRLVPDGHGAYTTESSTVREVLLQDLVEAIDQHINPRLVMR